MKKSSAKSIKKIYEILLQLYGPQGWWPLMELKNSSEGGYHPGNYQYPENESQCFEICLGAILTQSTRWNNVEKALKNLKKKEALDPRKIMSLEKKDLEEMIRPAGYFRQKARKLYEFSRFYLQLKGKSPSRENLLNIWGIGPETADSILLYAYKKYFFVIDAYTRRISENLALTEKEMKYDEVRCFFEKNLPRSLALYQEYHALLVKHAKIYYSSRNTEKKCPLYYFIRA